VRVHLAVGEREKEREFTSQWERREREFTSQWERERKSESSPRSGGEREKEREFTSKWEREKEREFTRSGGGGSRAGGWGGDRLSDGLGRREREGEGEGEGGGGGGVERG
jgi:hypothetical protein